MIWQKVLEQKYWELHKGTRFELLRFDNNGFSPKSEHCQAIQ